MAKRSLIASSVGCFMLGTMALTSTFVCTGAELTGRVLDPQGRSVPNARVRLQTGASETTKTTTDDQGGFRLLAISPGSYRLTAEASGFQAAGREIAVADGNSQRFDVTLSGIVGQHDSVVITAKTVEPGLDLRNAEVFNRTLFTRDDQVNEDCQCVL